MYALLIFFSWSHPSHFCFCFFFRKVLAPLISVGFPFLFPLKLLVSNLVNFRLRRYPTHFGGFCLQVFCGRFFFFFFGPTWLFSDFNANIMDYLIFFSSFYHTPPFTPPRTRRIFWKKCPEASVYYFFCFSCLCVHTDPPIPSEPLRSINRESFFSPRNCETRPPPEKPRSSLIVLLFLLRSLPGFLPLPYQNILQVPQRRSIWFVWNPFV